ncbi:MAG: AsmA family protein, partial [Rhodovibrionaceae bacterium]
MKLKWILTGIAAVIVAAVVAAVAILATMDFEQYRGLIEAEAKKATGRDLSLNGPIDLSISLTPAIVVEDVTFSNAEGGSRENMASLDRFEAEVEILPLLSGDIQINRIVLVNADILLETDANGTPNWQFQTGQDGAATDSGTSGGSGSQTLPTVDSVAVENSRITYINGVSGEQMVVAVDSLTMTQSGDKIDLDLAGSYQDIPLDLAGTVGSPATLMAGGSYPIDLSGSVAGADLSVSGSVANITASPSPDLTISVSGDNLSDFNALAGGGLPDAGPYEFSGRVTSEDTTYKVEGMNLSLADTALSGAVSVDMSGERPMVTGSLTSPLVDLGALPGTDGEDSAEETASENGADSQYVIPDEPLPLDALRAADADLSLKIDTLRVKEGMEVSALDLTLNLQNGRLSVSPMTGVFSGGQMNLDLTLDGSQETPSLATKFAMLGMDYGSLLKNMDVSQDVEGTMDIKLDLTGRGRSPHEIASTLNGTTEVISEEGVITNKLL